MRKAALALVVLASSATLNAPTPEAREALAGIALGPGPSRCWKAPQSRTVEEAVIAAQNQANVAARPRSTGPAAMLALSDGRLKSAYGAGLLVGWGETGARPEFAVVTAVAFVVVAYLLTRPRMARIRALTAKRRAKALSQGH